VRREHDDAEERDPEHDRQHDVGIHGRQYAARPAVGNDPRDVQCTRESSLKRALVLVGVGIPPQANAVHPEAREMLTC